MKYRKNRTKEEWRTVVTRVRDLMKSEGINRHDACIRAGVSPNSISRHWISKTLRRKATISVTELPQHQPIQDRIFLLVGSSESIASVMRTIQ